MFDAKGSRAMTSTTEPQMNAEKASHPKVIRIIRALILVLCLSWLALPAGLAWLFARSECPLSTTLRVLTGRETVAGPREFASRMVLRRSEAGLDLWSTPEGSIWTVHGDTALPFLLAEQSRDVYEAGGHIVRRGDIVLDCGANIGEFTRRALLRGAGLVVAIEPSPRTVDALRRNLDVEIRMGRVVVYPKGVWDRDAELELSIDEQDSGSNSLVLSPKAGSKIRVPLTTIDKIVAELKLPRVDFIKMDIEGAEKRALAGGGETIRHFRPRMSLSTEHLPDDATAIPAVVKSIEPRYTYYGCDCVWTDLRSDVKALVLAFDPV